MKEYTKRIAPKHAEYIKARRAADPEKFKQAGRRYYIANREAVLARNKNYHKANPQVRRRLNQTRKGVMVVGTHTLAETTQLMESQKFTCANPYCGVTLTDANKHLDHVVPITKGGCNCVFNLQWLCQPCNDSKHNKDWSEWLKTQARA